MSTICHQSCLDAELIRLIGDGLAETYRQSADRLRVIAPEISQEYTRDAENAHKTAQSHVELIRRGIRGLLIADGARWSERLDNDLALGRLPTPCREMVEVAS